MYIAYVYACVCSVYVWCVSMWVVAEYVSVESMRDIGSVSVPKKTEKGRESESL